MRENVRGRLISRRRFLGGAGLAGILALLFRAPIARLLRSTVRVGSAAAADTAPLADHERSTLMAFARALIPSSFTLQGASSTDQANAVIRAILDEHVADGAFNAAVEFLDGKSRAAYRARFVELDMDRQRQLVNVLFGPYKERTLLSSPYYYMTEDGRGIRRLWSAVARPIIYGFYTSALGWQVVGYPRRPGECSNLIDYQFPLT